MSEKTPSKIVPPPPERVCHVFKVPATYVEESEVLRNPLDKNSGLVTVPNLKTTMGYLGCNVNCALYDKPTGNCLDVEAKRALARLPAQIDLLDGLLRQPRDA